MDMITISTSEEYIAYTRGSKALVVTTNSHGMQEISLKNLPFAPLTVLCNLLNDGDCVHVQTNRQIDITLRDCLPKVYVVTSSAV